MAGSSAFVTSLVINVAIFLIVVLLFGYLRRRHPILYQPRCKPEDLELPFPHSVDYKRPLPPDTRFFGWLISTVIASEEQVYENAGLDALFYLRMMKFGMMFSGFCTIVGVLILIPINATAGAYVEVPATSSTNSTLSAIEGIDVLSLSNVPTKSDRFWAVLVALYMFAFVAMWLLRKYFADYTFYRQRWFHDQQKRGNFMSVMVASMPSTTDTDDKAASWFQSLYPSSYVSSSLVKDCRKLADLIEERDEIISKLEHAHGVLRDNIAKAKAKNDAGDAANFDPDDEKHVPMHKIDRFLKCLGGRKVASIPQYERELEELNARIADEQQTKKKTSQVAFCTLSDPVDVAGAARVEMSAKPGCYESSLAPEPRDVYWPNLFHSAYSLMLRRVLMQASTVWLIIFWTIPVAFVSALTTLEALSARFSFLEFMQDLNPAIKGFLEGFLPGLALLIFLIILPMILTVMTKVEGVRSHSGIQRGLFQKFFYFQAINNFLLLVLSSAVFDDIDAFIDDITDPARLTNILGTTIPKAGTFFCVFLMINAFSVFPLQLLAPAKPIVAYIKTRWLAKTDKERRQAVTFGAGEDMGVRVSLHMLIFIIAIAYAPIYPLINIFSLTYFVSGFITAKYNALYVEFNLFESGGMFWPMIHQRLVYSILLSQLTMIGLLGLKEVPIVAGLSVPVPILTWLAHKHILMQYHSKSRFQSTEGAVLSRKDVTVLPFDPYVQRELSAITYAAASPDGENGGDVERGKGKAKSQSGGSGRVSPSPDSPNERTSLKQGQVQPRAVL